MQADESTAKQHTPLCHQKRKIRTNSLSSFLYAENSAIVAGFQKGFADEQKANKNSAKNVFVRKAPSGRELSSVCETEGECVKNTLESLE